MFKHHILTCFVIVLFTKIDEEPTKNAMNVDTPDNKPAKFGAILSSVGKNPAL